MKTFIQNLFLTLALLAGIHQAGAQLPIITSFSQNGLLVCTNLQTNTVASVQWASSLTGSWQTNWDSLNAVAVNSNGTISVSVPMFYRVLGVAATNNQTFTADGMALIPAGSFTMGDTLDGEGDAIPTNVYVSAFYISTNLVSYSQWQTVYNWATTKGYGFDDTGSGKAANHPVQSVDWYDTVKWCNARSQQAGLTPAYYSDAGLTQVYTNGDTDTVYPNWAANGYRLPTEAEWEKAARGGLTGLRFAWGNTISESQANYDACTTCASYDLGPSGFNSNYNFGAYPYTSPVGSFAPNGYGLFDMAGNVMVWCWDWYGKPYAGGTNPHGPDSSSAGTRVVRGGNWGYGSGGDRCACRTGIIPPTFQDIIFGFRCVRGL